MSIREHLPQLRRPALNCKVFVEFALDAIQCVAMDRNLRDVVERSLVGGAVDVATIRMGPRGGLLVPPPVTKQALAARLKQLTDEQLARLVFMFETVTSAGKRVAKKLAQAQPAGVLIDLAQRLLNHHVPDDLPRRVGSYVNRESAESPFGDNLGLPAPPLHRLTEHLAAARVALDELQQGGVRMRGRDIDRARKKLADIGVDTTRAFVEPPTKEQIHQIADKLEPVLVERGLPRADARAIVSRVMEADGIQTASAPARVRRGTRRAKRRK